MNIDSIALQFVFDHDFLIVLELLANNYYWDSSKLCSIVELINRLGYAENCQPNL